jgi:hypothetical protein
MIKYRLTFSFLLSLLCTQFSKIDPVVKKTQADNQD